MGRSYTQASYEVLQSWEDHCEAQGNASNIYTGHDGNKYMFEEYYSSEDDVAVKGDVYVYSKKGTVVRVGEFVIETDGTVTKEPRSLYPLGE